MAYVASGRPAPRYASTQVLFVSDGLAVELVGRELVDRVVHPGAEHGDPSAEERHVGAEVGEELDLEPGHGAVLGGRQRQRLPLVAAVVARHHRLRAGLGELAGLPEPAGDGEGGELLGRRLELATETAADVGGDDADLGLGDARRRGHEEPEDVGDLRGRPDDDLLAGRVDDGGPRLHERGHEPLLAVLALDDDAVLARLGDGCVDVATRAGGGGVELPEGGAVGAQVGVHEHLVLHRLSSVEHGRELVVVDVDELGGVAGCRRGAGGHDGDDLAGARDAVDGHGEVGGGLLLVVQRPGVGDGALAVLEVGAGEDADDAGGRPRRARVDVRDGRVGERAAHHGEVQHPGELDVVGPPGAAGEEALVLLAAPGLADLRGGAVLDGGHRTALLSGSAALEAALHRARTGRHRLDDVVVARAPAEVALEPEADLLLGGVRVVAEDVDRLHDHPRCAEAALEGVVLVERLLHRVQRAVLGDALDGRDLVPVGLDGQDVARLHAAPVEVDGARTAVARVAPDDGADLADDLSQVVDEQQCGARRRRSTGLRRP